MSTDNGLACSLDCAKYLKEQRSIHEWTIRRVSVVSVLFTSLIIFFAAGLFIYRGFSDFGRYKPFLFIGFVMLIYGCYILYVSLKKRKWK